MKMTKGIHRIQMAEKLLKKLIVETNESHRISLIFQFCKQMKLFCESMALSYSNAYQADPFLKLSESFDTYSKFYRTIKSDKAGPHSVKVGSRAGDME